ncbi:hypothetical protein OS493_031556 [Desmophyllum pertusum]|uniref:Uncharacterized protein n=1 Tax=Desmophyllum pertusum TaxID=174260 RepID=A0A9W9YW66_9CNID|nr:hypothetical protein OS493_031556 [Desmophyllum pertusum]
MEEAYSLAMKNISKSAADGKKQYDRKRNHLAMKAQGTILHVTASEAEQELLPEPPESEEDLPRPVRNRHPPNVLCYDQLGNPSYHPCNASSIQVTTGNFAVDPVMYCPPYQPWIYCHGTLDPRTYWKPTYYIPVYPPSVPFYSINGYQYVPPMAF